MSLPPAIETSPDADVKISSSRDTLEGASPAPGAGAMSGRRPAYEPMTSAAVRHASGK